MNEVRLIAITVPVDPRIGSTEEIVGYCARVSNPSNQGAPSSKLMKYCMDHKHWSVFTMVNAVLEINTTRDIGRQFTRHTSLQVFERDIGEYMVRYDGFDYHSGGVQEFSQRYAGVPELVSREGRLQDDKNRQMSHEADEKSQKWFQESMNTVRNLIYDVYQSLLQGGIAKESARVILPEGLSPSRLYVNGTLRSWMHFLETRLYGEGVQKEHRELALAIREALLPYFPETLPWIGQNS